MDLDIKGFFDHVNHEILMKLVGQVVKGRRVLGLLHGWLKAGVMEEGKLRYTTSGTPQYELSRRLGGARTYVREGTSPRLF